MAAILVGAGLVLAILAPARWRPFLIPAAPVVGAALAVAYIHWTGLIVGFSSAGPVFAVASLVGLVWMWLRRRAALNDARGLLISMLILLAAGIPGMAINLSATSDVDSTGLRFTSPGSDGFYFASVDDWLMDHTVWDVPDRSPSATSPDSPANDPVRQYQLGARRWGEAGIQNLASSVFRTQSSDQWIPMTALWLLFIAPATYALALGLGVSRRRSLRAGVLGGVGVGGLGSLGYFLLNQNSMFVLGLGIGMFAVGALLFLVRSDEPPGAHELALVGLAVVGLLGTEFEYAFVLAPALIAGLAPLLWRHRSRWRWLMMAVVATLVVGPLAVFNAVRGLLFLTGVENTWPDQYSFGPIVERLGRILGSFPVDTFGVPANALRGPITVLLGLAWLTGLIVALRAAPTRWPVIALIGTMCPYWWFLVGGTMNYVPNRIVAMSVPTGMVLICIGVSTSLPLVWATKVRPRVAGRLGLVAVSMTAIVGLVAATMMTNDTVRHHETLRGIGLDDSQAVEWIRTYGGPSGSRVIVADPLIHRQLFVMDRTSDLRDVGWLQLQPAYPRRLLFEPLEPASFALMSRSAVPIGITQTLEQNSTWELIDIRRGGVYLGPETPLRSAAAGGFERWSSTTPIDVPIAVGAACANVTVDMRSAADRTVTQVDVGLTANGPFVPTDVLMGPGTRTFELPVSSGGLAFVRLGGSGESGAAAAEEGRASSDQRPEPDPRHGVSADIRISVAGSCG